MAYPDLEKPFVLHVDASEKGLGAVLYQRQNGSLRVIAYGSRTLTAAERNYKLHSGKLEFLALKWAVTEQCFRDYLFHAPHFVVYRDNNPLTYVTKSAKLNATGHRWVAELADYRFTLKYRPGSANRDADFLSRQTRHIEEIMQECTEECRPEVMESISQALEITQRGEINWSHLPHHKQSFGPEKNAPCTHLQHRQKLGETEGVRQLLKEWHHFQVHDDGIPRRKTVYRNQLVVPESLKPLIYKHLHEEMGHLGADRMVALARERFFWPKMREEIEHYVTRERKKQASHMPVMQKGGEKQCKKPTQLPMRNMRKAADRGKRNYNQRTWSSSLEPGDNVLVRNLTPRGGPGKLRSYWEDMIYVVRERRLLSDRVKEYQTAPAKKSISCGQKRDKPVPPSMWKQKEFILRIEAQDKEPEEGATMHRGGDQRLRLKEFGLKLSPEKCIFFQTPVRYLGHIVSRNGVETDPEKITALKTWPIPQNLRKLRSFLGFAGYYRRFVKSYSSIVKPLHDLISGYPPSQKKARMKQKSEHYRNPKEIFGDRWSPACQQAFEQVIHHLTTAPVLGFADPQKPYVLHTDASTTATQAEGC
ncbi:hypothetical protein L3Q82_016744 [Scortum barcoo]|uniref:Uncharacterized protein n=1 Tax=Scortum barcoo TaxID=214431 RepID=A0ACB8X8N3_9TELE|nr:hypothetical protein L3Q82_016744 [Scortum barcoo]